MGTGESVGSSGGVFGCICAVGSGVARLSSHTHRIRRDVTRLTLFGVLNLGLGFWIPMIDNAAHLGGTLMGFGLGLCGPALEKIQWEKK